MKTKSSWDINKTNLFHFTTVENLIMMLATGKIKLSSCRRSKNIAVEIMALESAIIEALSDTETGGDLRAQYPGMSDDEIINDLISHRESSYIACFIKLKEKQSIFDTHTKYLWKYYANDNLGVVLEFDYKQFPYTCTGTQSSSITGKKEDLIRDTEFRLIDVDYDKEKFIRILKNYQSDFHSLRVDSYKPSCCTLEHESRLIVHLKDDNDLSGLQHGVTSDDIRCVSVNEFNSNNRPTSLYYDILSCSGGKSAISKVYCKSELVYKKLLRLLPTDTIVIDNNSVSIN